MQCDIVLTHSLCVCVSVCLLKCFYYIRQNCLVILVFRGACFAEDNTLENCFFCVLCFVCMCIHQSCYECKIHRHSTRLLRDSDEKRLRFVSWCIAQHHQDQSNLKIATFA